MHPDDERYSQHKHGDTFEAEWINGPITATVIKDEAIDPEFGTGVMTITPWHSAIDFEIAERHGLDKEQIIDEDGKLLPIADEFEGMPIADARQKIVDKLHSKGLLVKINDMYEHKIAVNERGKGVIEPQIKLQWWIDVNKPVVDWKGEKKSLKEVLQSVVREGDIDIIPARFEKTYFHWIDNLRDWCISRQIWWGHQVPAWYKDNDVYVGTQPPKDEKDWERDPDTLDTWFSSALWTWSTLVDPELAENYDLSIEDLLEKSADFQAYHPTNVMETGWDILFFWVARMILSTTYMTRQVPFKDVYLHGMVRAEDGKKMSKSRPESIIDPLEVIPKYGTDALRMALIMGVSPGNDQNWGQGKIEANRNFCNKIWNIARYIEGSLDDKLSFSQQPVPETLADHWIIHRINKEIDGAHEGNQYKGGIGHNLENYEFSQAYEKLYNVIWNEVADWYIESSKTAPNASVMSWVLETVLILAHSFAPFVTESIWQELGDDSILAQRQWPNTENCDNEQANHFEEIKKIVTEVRHMRATLKLQGGELAIADKAFASSHGDLIKRLAKLEAISNDTSKSGLKLTQASQDCLFVIDQDTAKKFLKSLKDTYGANEKSVLALEGRLKNKSYVEKAPEHLVQATKDQIKSLKSEQQNVSTQIKQFENI